MICLPHEELPCRVVDISMTGARLCTSRSRFPPQFNLRYLGRLFGCIVAWQHNFDVGVAFCEPRTEPEKPNLAPLAGAAAPKIGVRELRSKLFGK